MLFGCPQIIQLRTKIIYLSINDSLVVDGQISCPTQLDTECFQLKLLTFIGANKSLFFIVHLIWVDFSRT